MRWDELEAAQPRLAAVRPRLLEPGVVLVMTIRRDGTPRLSPVEPLITGGELWLSMMDGSRKAHDLVRDPRVLVHSVVTDGGGGEGEVKLRGAARAEHDPGVQRRYADAVAAQQGWTTLVGRFHLFALDITEVAVVRYDSSTHDQFVTRWPAGEEFVWHVADVGRPARDLLTD